MSRPSPAPVAHHDPADVSLDAVFRQHFDYLWRVSRSLVGPSLADDVVQEVFLLLRVKLETFTGGSIRAWLYGLTRNVARNALRSRARRERRDHLAGLALVPQRTEPVSRAHEAADLMDRFLSRLPRAQREAFVLKELEGLTAAEISSALGVPMQTVYSRVRAAKTELSRFRDELKKEHE